MQKLSSHTLYIFSLTRTFNVALCINSVPISDNFWFCSFSQISGGPISQSPKMYISRFHLHSFPRADAIGHTAYLSFPCSRDITSYHSIFPPIRILPSPNPQWSRRIYDPMDNREPIRFDVSKQDICFCLFISFSVCAKSARNIFCLMKDCYWCINLHTSSKITCLSPFLIGSRLRQYFSTHCLHRSPPTIPRHPWPITCSTRAHTCNAHV